MPWSLAGLDFTALVIIGGIIFGWTYGGTEAADDVPQCLKVCLYAKRR